MEKYTLETLLPLNFLYNHEHIMRESDVDMANKYKAVIEASRTDDKVQTGDIVQFTDKYGNFYRNAHVEKICDETGRLYICEQAHTPFIWLNDAKDNIKCSAGGGAWRYVPANLTLIEKRKKQFCDWGYYGARGNGAVRFEAFVNVWEYKDPDPIHGEYTTEHYDKQFISYVVDERGNPKDGSRYRYFGSFSSGIAFETTKDYQAWLKTYRGVEFKGNWHNQTIVFHYKSIKKYIPKEEYDALELPTDTRWCNGTIEVKVQYDDEACTVTEYRYTNDGSELAKKGVKPYALARQTD